MTEDKTPFEEVGEYIAKENMLRELAKDPECASIMLILMEEQGWECR